MIIDSEFSPAKGLKNPDIQSLFPIFARYRMKVSMRRERLELKDGDFLDLEWVGEGDGPIVIMLHGMGGNSDSSYIKGLMKEIVHHRWRGVMMYFRGCSDTANRLPVTYHFGQTNDLTELLDYIGNKYPNTPLYAVGFSMGGNIVLKWLGENPDQKLLQAAIAVSTPYDLRATSANIRRGKGRFYQWVLLRNLRRYVNKKYNYPLAPVNIKMIPDIKSFWDLDEKITAPLNGFKNAVDYYHKTSCGTWLRYIKTPTLIIHALDDPLIPRKTIPTVSQLSPAIILEISKHGGHVGFVSGTLKKPTFWLDTKIMSFFAERLNVNDKVAGNIIHSYSEASEWKKYA